MQDAPKKTEPQEAADAILAEARIVGDATLRSLLALAYARGAHAAATEAAEAVKSA